MRYFFLVLSCLATTLLIAQESRGQWCGTVRPDIDRNLLEAPILANKATLASGVVFPRNTRYIPIKFHLTATDEGIGRISEHRLLDQLCELNEDFAPYDMQFYFAESGINYVNNTVLYEDHPRLEETLMQEMRDSRSMNVFVVDEAGGADSPGTLAYYHLQFKWIVISNSYFRGNDGTLSHEIGHFFSLLHPFYGYDFEPFDTPNVNAPNVSPAPFRIPTERANGSNCNNSGDFICDTPADYNNGLGASRCEHTANILDPQGNRIEPEERNMMSYFLLCPDEEYFFSDDQVALMHADYASADKRSLRLNATPEVVTNFGAAPEAVYPPANGDSEFFDEINFEWTPTTGATSYVFELSRVSAFTVVSERTIVNGTSYTYRNPDLLQDRRYYWRVRPFNAHGGCTAERSTRFQFTTSDISAEGGVSTQTIKELSDLRVAPNPAVIGTDDLILALNAGAPFTANVELLSMTGQSVLGLRQVNVQAGEQQIRLPIANLASGVYLLRLRSDVGQVTQKVVLSR